jgi:thiol-disulfide isomerase/thioredoxin
MRGVPHEEEERIGVTDRESTVARRISPRLLILIAVVVVFLALVAVKVMPAPVGGSAGVATSPVAGKPSEAHADASVAYEAALAQRKPVYVLFHSLTCQPCIEISAVADRVVPAYAGKVVFVNALSDDPGSQQLMSELKFQYIPTSFFIDGSGKVVGSFTGVLSDGEMKARLDKLAAQ